MLERYINVWHIITLMEREAEINIEKSDWEIGTGSADNARRVQADLRAGLVGE
jgi:hypothetical protein